METINQRLPMVVLAAVLAYVGNTKKLVKEEDPAMKCEICDQWYHIKCQNITKADYNYTQGGTRKKSLSQMHWCCQTCDKMAVNIMKTMTSLHAKQQKNGREDDLGWNTKSTKRQTGKTYRSLKDDVTSIKDGQRKILEDQDKKIKEIVDAKQNNTRNGQTFVEAKYCDVELMDEDIGKSMQSEEKV